MSAKKKSKKKKNRPQMRKGYVCECRVCGNGLVRYFKFRDEVVGLCDECELVWDDVAKLFANPGTKAVGSYPMMGSLKGKEAEWKRATRRDVDRAGLGEFVEGYSD